MPKEENNFMRLLRLFIGANTCEPGCPGPQILEAILKARESRPDASQMNVLPVFAATVIAMSTSGANEKNASAQLVLLLYSYEGIGLLDATGQP
jgi:hypothetical protein